MSPKYTFVIVLLLLYIPSSSTGFQASIKGTVLDSQTGRPLAGANVEILGTSLGTATDLRGEFIISDVQLGTHTLKVTYIGYKPVQKIITLSSNRPLSLKILLEQTAIEGESVIVMARAETDRAIIRETPIAFTTLSKMELTNNYTTGDLPDLVQNVPGVWTSSAGLGESDMYIRGFSSDRVRFLVNDIPINNPEDHQVYWSDWAGLANAVQSISVHRGPGFSLYGASAFGGSVHIETIGVEESPSKAFRVSAGMFNRMGIQTGPDAGKMIDQATGEVLDDVPGAVNHTYSGRFNSGPRYDGKLNVSFYFEYKTGDSYILGTLYDGFTLGLSAESLLRNHRLKFDFIVSPQAHNQAFVLQDINLLGILGREYNRKNHTWQENHFTKPIWTLKHEWLLSDNLTLINNGFVTIGRGADQSLVNDVFDVETGVVDFQTCTKGKDAQAFGYHAQYLYNNYGLLTSDFIPSAGRSPSWFKGIEVYNEFGIGTNFFVDQHTHSYQNRRRRDHWQTGVISYLSHKINEKVSAAYGIDARLWHGHRISEAWRLKISNVDDQGRSIWTPYGTDIFTGKVQSIYDFRTSVFNLTPFGRMTWKPLPCLTVQGGVQLFVTHMEIIEVPIPLLDFGTWEFFTTAKRTTADQLGERKFSWCSDYVRNYAYFTGWTGANLNLTNSINLFTRFAHARNEPAILDWYDHEKGPLLQAEYYPEREEAVPLIPESVLSKEIGIAYHSLICDAQANYYHTDYSNKIASVVDINDRRTTLNAGSALFQGLETELRVRLKGFELTCAGTIARNRWKKITVKEFFGSAAGDVVGKVVPFAPERMLMATLGYTIAPHSANKVRLGVGLNYWDEYYGTYTNMYTRMNRIIAADGLPYWVGSDYEARLPYFLDLSAQISYTRKMEALDLTLRIDAHNLLNRADNFMRAQYSIDYTRTDGQAGRYNWYVLQAPLFNLYFTAEIAIH